MVRRILRKSRSVCRASRAALRHCKETKVNSLLAFLIGLVLGPLVAVAIVGLAFGLMLVWRARARPL